MKLTREVKGKKTMERTFTSYEFPLYKIFISSTFDTNYFIAFFLPRYSYKGNTIMTKYKIYNITSMISTL